MWSSSGDERIIVFTTNYKDRLDPALLRPGRMDVHIHMSYCTPCSFKILARNYLDIKHHELFMDIERLIEEVEVSPAEVAEQLLKKNEPDSALRGLLEFLELKYEEKEKTKTEMSGDDESEDDESEDDESEDDELSNDSDDTNTNMEWMTRIRVLISRMIQQNNGSGN